MRGIDTFYRMLGRLRDGELESDVMDAFMRSEEIWRDCEELARIENTELCPKKARLLVAVRRMARMTPQEREAQMQEMRMRALRQMQEMMAENPTFGMF